MPKVQVYLKHSVIDDIKGLVDEDIQAGANPAEVSFSSKSAMLLELGLRVYNLRRSDSSGSSHDEFDRMLLQAALETKYLCQFMMKSIGDKEGVNSTTVRERVDGYIARDMEQFFHEEEGEG